MRRERCGRVERGRREGEGRMDPVRYRCIAACISLAFINMPFYLTVTRAIASSIPS